MYFVLGLVVVKRKTNPVVFIAAITWCYCTKEVNYFSYVLYTNGEAFMTSGQSDDHIFNAV